MARTYKDVATVRELRIYPVKSMAGSELSEARLGWHGLAGDRRYGFVKTGSLSGLPFLSARELPRITLYSASYMDPRDPDRSEVNVVTPEGRTLSIRAEALLAELEQLSAQQLHLQHLWRGCFDAMDISLITLDSIRTMSSSTGRNLETSRFRPNLVLEAKDPKPFPEEAWIGETLRIGDRPDSAWLRADRRDQRCQIVNLDPTTADSSPEVMAEIVRQRKNNLGVYGTTVRPGTMGVGDTVFLVN
jgi:uncharacterized protein YcbX